MIWTLLTILASILSAIGLYFYIKSVRLGKYWKNKGFPNLSSKETGHVFIDTFFRGVHQTEFMKNFYKAMQARNLGFVGFLEFFNPAIMVKDMDLLRQIYVKDFDHFSERRDLNLTELDNFTGKMLVFLEGEEWKDLRSKMSPTFTTGKIRKMFELMETCGQRMTIYLEQQIQKSPTVDFTQTFGKFAIDVISACAFGIESGAFGCGTNTTQFEAMAEKLQFKITPINVIKLLIVFTVPKLAGILGYPLFDNPEANEFFSSIIKSAIKHRETSGEKRQDFLQLMLEARDGQLKLDEAELNDFEKEAILRRSEGHSKITLNEHVICAQSILFFLAGFDTTTTLLQFAGYQLALEPQMQQKLYEEVNEAYEKNGGKFTYESIHELEYLDKFISETLRMYPPAPTLDRRCVRDYKIPGTDLIIPTKTIVVFPIFAIHRDETIYPEPNRFDPERFSKEAKAKRSPYAFMPFGHGPRNCIGMRFALTESKLGIAELVHKFIVEPCEKTKVPMKFANSTTLKPEGGMWLNLRKREN